MRRGAAGSGAEGLLRGREGPRKPGAWISAGGVGRNSFSRGTLSSCTRVPSRFQFSVGPPRRPPGCCMNLEGLGGRLGLRKITGTRPALSSMRNAIKVKYTVDFEDYTKVIFR